MSDNVDHPKHYNSHPSGIECIDVVEHMSFNVGNAMKYLWRADEKGSPIGDLQKAKWYIEREIERRDKAAAILCQTVSPLDGKTCRKEKGHAGPCAVLIT